MKLTIEKIGINGEGIGFIDKKPVFVKNALPQEVVEIRILESFPKYKLGEVTGYSKKTYDRIKPQCTISESCGSCNMMHAKYEKQLEYKYDVLRQTLIKYAQVNPKKIKKLIANEKPFYYRNSFKLPFGMDGNRLVLGMYASNSNYFVPVQECIVHEKGLEQIKRKILNVLNRYHHQAFNNFNKGGLRYLVVRGFQDKYQVTIVSGVCEIEEDCIEEIMEIDGIVSLWQAHNPTKKTVEIIGNKLIHLAGKKKLSFRFMGLRLQLSPKSFFQLNTDQASKLYKTVDNLLKPNQNVIVEAYSGVGVMSLMASKKAKEVIGIESIKDAVSNANKSAMRNDIENVKFIAGDAAKEMIQLTKKKQIDTLIVDPPRSGLDDSMLKCLKQSKIESIVYISCNPATLAKNIKMLENEYEVISVQPIDMFSQTAHIETVALMTKIKK